LAAAFGVERRLLELRLEGAVAEVGVRKNRGQDVRALVADELAARPRHAHLDVEPGALPRALPLLLHEARELLFVHLEASLGSELLRQLPREAVRVVEPEPVFRRDLALRDHLLEEALAAFEGLAEALLLGAHQLSH